MTARFSYPIIIALPSRLLSSPPVLSFLRFNPQPLASSPQSPPPPLAFSLHSCAVNCHFHTTLPFAFARSSWRDLGHSTFVLTHGKGSAVSSPSGASPFPDCKRAAVLSHTTAVARQKSNCIQAEGCG